MKVTVQDSEVLSSLPPLDVVGYLRASGWIETEKLQDKGSVWALRRDGDVEIIVPARRDLRDFILRMADVIRTLSEVEARSQLEILHELTTAGADVVRVRATTVDPSGAIPIGDGVALVEHARDMILAAACAAIEPRPAYHTRKPDKATEYLRRVRMGQTERGSFVLTILSPVGPTIGQPHQLSLLSEPEDSYERAVMITLVNSVKAVTDAVQTAVARADFSPFQEAVARGVSANLCEALAGLSRAVGDFEVGVSWSRLLPASIENARVSFSADSAPVMEDAARNFRAREPIEDQTVTGFVVHLHRTPQQEEGRVTLRVLVDGKPRNIVARLAQPDYSIAVRAHDDKLPITCQGDVVREGHEWLLRNPRALAIVPVEGT